MDNSKETCCLCLSVSNSPFISLYSKSEGILNYFDKISSTLSQLANVLNNIGSDCLICENCCNTIEMIFNFNRTCLQNAQTYSSQKGISLPEEMLVKKEEENISHFMDICQVQLEVEEEVIKKECVEDDHNVRKLNNLSNTSDELAINKVIEISVEVMQNVHSLEAESSVQTFHEKEKVHTSHKERTRSQIEEKAPAIHRERKLPQKAQFTGKNCKGQTRRRKRNSNEDFTCRVCNKTFKHASTLSQHKKVHSAVKPFVCETCGRGFNFKKNLNLHMLTHTGQKSHICTTCNKAFSCSSNLKIHLRTHTGEKPYMCHVCGASFATRDSLNRHSLVHTDLKPYECKLCKKTFRKKGHLNSHMMIHSGEKPYECKHCDKRFRQLSAHIRHTMLHTGERPHACTMCDRSFTTKWKLSEHKRSHMKNITSS